MEVERGLPLYVPASVVIEIAKNIDNTKTLITWARSYSMITCIKSPYFEQLKSLIEEQKRLDKVFIRKIYKASLQEDKIKVSVIDFETGNREKFCHRKRLPERFKFLFLLSNEDLLKDDLLARPPNGLNPILYCLRVFVNRLGEKDGNFILSIPNVNAHYGHHSNRIVIYGTLVNGKVNGKVYIRKECYDIQTILICKDGNVIEHTSIHNTIGFTHNKWKGKEVDYQLAIDKPMLMSRMNMWIKPTNN